MVHTKFQFFLLIFFYSKKEIEKQKIRKTFWIQFLQVVHFINDEVLISSVERAQLSPIPLLEDTTSSCMVTGVVPATTPPTLKLGIKECNILK